MPWILSEPKTPWILPAEEPGDTCDGFQRNDFVQEGFTNVPCFISKARTTPICHHPIYITSLHYMHRSSQFRPTPTTIILIILRIIFLIVYHQELALFPYGVCINSRIRFPKEPQGVEEAGSPGN